ncbi:MAG: ABC transporter ATP-binding protein [Chloroflexales bacterium]|nr:ABC transporter ATP-binding protein [Chloroflexales bacterium]
MTSKSTSTQGPDIVLFRLMYHAVKPHWRPLAVAFVLLGITAGLNVVPPSLLQWAIDGPIATGNTADLWPITALYGGTAIAMFIIQYIYSYFLQKAGQRALSDMRTNLFNRIMSQDQAFFHRNPVGDLVTRLTSDVDTLSALISTSAVTIVTETATLLVTTIVMFSVNWRLALLVIAVLPILVVVTQYFSARVRTSSTGERTALARVSAYLNEQLQGIPVLQVFGAQHASTTRFDGFNNAYRNALIVLRRHSALFLMIQEFISAIGLAMLLYGGGQGVLAGWASLGMLVAFIQYADRAFQPVLRLSEQYNAVQIAFGAADRIQYTLSEASSINAPDAPTPPTYPFTGDVRLENIHFSYNADQPVLRGINLHIPAGQRVAIVGPTGAGKSSLIGLLARWYDPQLGRIFLDGIDIRQLDPLALRGLVSVIPHDPITFEGDIAFNVRLYRDSVPYQTILDAAQTSNAAAFIERMPAQYQSWVTTNGASLSAGERQLLALARAIALQPNGILILDEATSSIDTTTESLVQEALERLFKGRTSIIIAHRLATVRSADRILVVQQGLIVEDGNHNELIAQNGMYAKLYAHQLIDSA